jgi:hypothetical protein
LVLKKRFPAGDFHERAIMEGNSLQDFFYG